MSFKSEVEVECDIAVNVFDGLNRIIGWFIKTVSCRCGFVVCYFTSIFLSSIMFIPFWMLFRRMPSML